MYLNKIKHYLLNNETNFKLLDFFKWKFIDLYRSNKYGVKPHLYGIRCITGMYGCGKTVSMTKLALDYRTKYGDGIYICTNFGLSIQDFAFTDIQQLVIQFDKPIIFMWDEVQNDFPATEKNFPKEITQALTLNRKGNGKMFYWASQDHELVHKTIRRLTIEYGQVKTFLGRFTRIKWYFDYDYKVLFEQNNVEKKLKIRPFKKLSFVQTDNLRNLYNSFAWDNGEKLNK